MTAVVSSERAPSPPLALPFAVLVMGGAALLAQVLGTRELLALFFGNELSIALVLAVWLLAVGAGSAAGTRFAPRLRSPAHALGWSQAAMAALLPFSLLVARRARWPALPPGEMLGPGPMLLISLETLGPAAALVGLQFVLAAAAAPRAARDGEAGVSSGVAMVYALEALGAALAGIAFHLYLAQHMMPLSAAAAVGVVSVISAAALLRPRLSLAGGGSGLVALALLAGLLWVVKAGPRLELVTLQSSPRWSGIHPVAFLPSKYGALMVTERDRQVSLYQSGVLLFTSQDDYTNEAAAHLALLEHREPRDVLLIGGAASGLAGEVLKHPIARLDCVELDPRVVELARRWMPESSVAALHDRRAHLYVGDGRLLVRGAPDRYDVVILNLPDPTTAAINRFYTYEFLQEARRALKPDGLLCLGLTGSEVHLSGSVLEGMATLDHTLSLVFPARVIVPGDRTLFLAGGAEAGLTSDWRVLSARIASRRIRTRFVNDAWLRDALLPFRAEMMREALSQVRHPRLNTDLTPVSYYYQTRTWLEQVTTGRSGTAAGAAWAVAGGVVAALLLWALVWLWRAPSGTVLMGIAALGGFGLVVELLALLVFQSACGYLYHALGLLIAVFMAGLAAGAAAVGRRRIEQPRSRALVIVGLGTAALVCLVLPNLLRSLVAAPALAPLALGALLLLAGSLVGGLFPVASALYRHQQGVAASAGAVYAADLIGSAGAALAVGAVTVPLLGVTGTSLVAAAVLALAAAALAAHRAS